ncbi:3-hydroxyacyl-CoA dehydrogenase NAD-binding domain-containing protein [Acinetobacter pittii]
MGSVANIVLEQQGQIGIVNFQTNKLNVLSHELRSGLYEAIQQLLANAEITAIVLAGSPQAFSAGADIAEFSTGTHLEFPSLHDLVKQISDATKPIVAAISGVAFGGGLELALACHHRVVQQKSQLALPEVNLGLLPGSAGTQLLPRYIGVETALDVMLSGKPLKLAALVDTKLLDAVTEGDAKQDAITFAAQLTRSPQHIKHHKMDATQSLATLLQAKRDAAGVQPQSIVQHAIINAVQAAVELDFEAGFIKEQQLFQQLVASDVSKALRHAFFAEREAKHVPDLDPTALVQQVEKVAVIGAGTMGSGIAICFLQAGYTVTLIENQQEGLDRGLGLIDKYFVGQVAKGRLAQEKAAALQANLTSSLDYAALAQVDLALEAVFEDWEVKTAVLQQMDQHLPAHAILASNTSTLDLNALAEKTSRPHAVVGLHFFSPAQIMPLLEIVRTERTDAVTLITALQIAKRLKKTAVVAGVCDGFIGNRMLNEYLRIAGLLIDTGASPYQIDNALENWGMAMGPFRMCDMAGNDIGYLIRKQQLKLNPDKKFSGIADQLVEMQRLGQKTQKGWYDYTQGNCRGDEDGEVLDLIDNYRQQNEIVPTVLTDGGIVARCIYALANEGFRLLQEGIALRQSDIDVVYLAGYGFPRWRGGPMFYAEEQGLEQMQTAMAQFAQDPYTDAEFWDVPALLKQKTSKQTDAT